MRGQLSPAQHLVGTEPPRLGQFRHILACKFNGTQKVSGNPIAFCREISRISTGFGEWRDGKGVRYGWHGGDAASQCGPLRVI